jgi:hypothetical protein
MDETQIRFSLPELYDGALSRFKAACRFDASKEMHANMLDDALHVHRKWAMHAELRAVCARFEPASRGRSLEIAGVAFSCAAFEQMDARNLIAGVVYALTLRADASLSSSLSCLLYGNLWENAYLEAALSALKSDFAARVGGLPSDSFGPGYYGMALEEMKKLARVLDFGRIGAAVREDGMIRPPKSCAGIFFVVRDAARMPKDACRDCAGNRESCAYCEHRARYCSKAGEPGAG